ncbi:MAG: hypothetical protein DCF12_20565 [Snowella sp.]|nr:MAG: hypothetical protein DCF12_20565 [Snowella sp.]
MSVYADQALSQVSRRMDYPQRQNNQSDRTGFLGWLDYFLSRRATTGWSMKTDRSGPYGNGTWGRPFGGVTGGQWGGSGGQQGGSGDQQGGSGGQQGGSGGQQGGSGGQRGGSGGQQGGSGGQQGGSGSLKLVVPKTAFNQQNTILVASNILLASKNPIDVLSTINNSIGNDISLVEQGTENLKANLESLLTSENRVNISALAPTNASAQKLQNSMSGLLKKLNEIPNDNAEVVVAKQNVLNELSKSVVGLEKTNDLIKAINKAVAQSE